MMLKLILLIFVSKSEGDGVSVTLKALTISDRSIPSVLCYSRAGNVDIPLKNLSKDTAAKEIPRQDML